MKNIQAHHCTTLATAYAWFRGIYYLAAQWRANASDEWETVDGV